METRNYTLDDVEPTYRPMIIDGEDVQARSGETFTRLSPAHEVEVTSFPQGGKDDVDRAVAAARRALEGGWRKSSGSQRSKLLLKVAEIVRRDAEELALAETLETGKPITQSRNEVAGTAELWEYAASLARNTQGDAHNALGPDTLALVVHEPIGVVGMITPWNFPLLIISQKLPFALAAGNTAVIKPSESTSATTVMLGRLIREAGFPAGVVNIVTGDRVVGSAIAEHPGIDMVSFTGSTGVGKSIAATAGRDLKKVELELGGKNPQLITPNADFTAAVDAGVFGGYFNVGQCCNSGSRLIVHRSIADEFAAAVVERAQHMRVGDPLKSDTLVGSLVNDAQLAVVERYVAEGRDAGAHLLTGGGRLDTGLDGRFYQPTVFTDVTAQMSIATDEIFGPVLSVLPYDTLEEAISIANSTSFGLSAGIWSNDINEALTAARDLRAGTVWVNRWMDGYPEVPFGGYGQSGIGRELGRQALAEFSELKTIQLQVGPRESRWVDAPDAPRR
ncbi:aldehyde dehydrogenase family protein [Arthrobacter sp. AZCC_0090]|uniref:aldehyde dehydrogenase family protein n=1 Tax=Arthrobacter sp. AZCC_0090 TaxID=2735881 RepID=UPI00160FB8C2|nr:aldehyde dehydrogenase family protein [Arthrobacter sp. AZCC_0090]MBB6402843.1 acyl-CoA reductase-like NAD-dependent aldehyde dehydrogenase [Arthrobacter sp. AZCC_0090]